jgi:hypothetical protein
MTTLSERLVRASVWATERRVPDQLDNRSFTREILAKAEEAIADEALDDLLETVRLAASPSGDAHGRRIDALLGCTLAAAVLLKTRPHSRVREIQAHLDGANELLTSTPDWANRWPAFYRQTGTMKFNCRDWLGARSAFAAAHELEPDNPSNRANLIITDMKIDYPSALAETARTLAALAEGNRVALVHALLQEPEAALLVRDLRLTEQTPRK